MLKSELEEEVEALKKTLTERKERIKELEANTSPKKWEDYPEYEEYKKKLNDFLRDLPGNLRVRCPRL